MISPNYRARVAVLLLGALTLVTSPASAGETAYTIRLSHRPHKGDKDVIERVSARVVNDSTKYEGLADPLERESSSGNRMVGDFEVLEVDDAGNSMAESLTIRSWMATEEGVEGESQVLPPGAKVVTRMVKGKTEYTVDGAKPPKKVLRYLESVLSLSAPGTEARYDDVFGSKQKRAAGDTWPINRDKAIEMYKERNMVARPEDVSGTVTLVGTQTYNGRPCLRIAADIKLEKYQMPEPTTEPTTMPSKLKMTLKAASMTNHSEWLVSTDGEGHREWVSFSSTYHYDTEGSYGGPRFHTDQTVRRETQIRSLRDVATTMPTTTITAPTP